ILTDALLVVGVAWQQAQLQFVNHSFLMLRVQKYKNYLNVVLQTPRFRHVAFAAPRVVGRKTACRIRRFCVSQNLFRVRSAKKCLKLAEIRKKVRTFALKTNKDNAYRNEGIEVWRFVGRDT
ncbi:MAG: hypothetical protein II645_07880, partial [Bacteroidaceae bacterium]|nr:hypothetical protein [Bacteroidaceae bacterium]